LGVGGARDGLAYPKAEPDVKAMTEEAAILLEATISYAEAPPQSASVAATPVRNAVPDRTPEQTAIVALQSLLEAREEYIERLEVSNRLQPDRRKFGAVLPYNMVRHFTGRSKGNKELP
jgi:hypothetical protein